MSEHPFVDLDDDRALDPSAAGAKAAMLAQAKKAGLPVLDGLVVPVEISRAAIARGRRALEERNSGFARAAITTSPMDPVLTNALTAALAHLGDRLVIRSSSVVEGDGTWAGAFASYAEMAPDEATLGVRGCWASVFAPDALARGKTSGVGPEDVGMAVLIQPEIQPDYGGVATVDPSGTVTIAAIAGTPAAIVSGWERGHVLFVDHAGAGPAPAVEAIGRERVEAVADLTRRAAASVDCHHIEWADSGGRLWLLQARAAPPQRPTRQPDTPDYSRQLSEVGVDVGPAELVRLVEEESKVGESGRRIGITKWEPALYEIVSSRGQRWEGHPAAPGWGAGRIRLVRDGDDAERFQPREIVAAMYPLNNLASLLWDAAGVVTIGGSPGAHLFEVANWLGLPALCGVDLGAATGRTLEELRDSTSFVGAIDGYGGTLTVLDSGA